MCHYGARLSNSFQTMSLEKNLESLQKNDEEVAMAETKDQATLTCAVDVDTYHRPPYPSESSASANVLLRLHWHVKACCSAADRRRRRDESCFTGHVWQAPSWLRGHGGAQQAGVSVATCIAATACQQSSIRLLLRYDS